MEQEKAKFDTFYFGCWGGTGHYLWTEGYGSVNHRLISDFVPWTMEEVASRLCPKGEDVRGFNDYQPEGLVKVHHKHGFTAIVFWDRSVDSRPGSNSGFYAPIPNTPFHHMKILFQERFPQVFDRFKFELKELK